MASFLNKISIVKQIPLFQQLNFFELNRISRKAVLVEYSKGDIICKQDAPADAFYCLVTGRVNCYTYNSAGHKENLESFHRGMHFGILSALTGENHSHNFEAINDSVILKIGREDFAEILKASPRLGLALSQSLSQRIRNQVVRQKGRMESVILSVYSPVKGSGSSTYAINLALNLQRETDKKVLFISLESYQQSQSDTTSAVETAPQWTRPGVNLQSIVDDIQKIRSSIVKGELNIDVLTANFDSSDHSLVTRISQFVSATVDEYNYIIVDLPNEMDETVLKTLTQSDYVHLVVKDVDKDLEMVRHVIERLKNSLGDGFKSNMISVLLSAVSGNPLRSLDEVHRAINYMVFNSLPLITSEQLKSTLAVKGLTIITPDPKSEYARAVVRIARKLSGVMIGLVLGGGAALGVAHIGVIRVLERENIPIDIVVGSSMGALIGSLWAMGKTSDELEFIAREFKNKWSMAKLMDPPLFPISGLVRGRGIKRWLASKLGNSTFIQTRIPFKAVSYDLLFREEHVIDQGSLVDAVQKSIAIPGVIKPITEHGQIIIDGGVLNPLPTNVMVDMGIKKIIAVNVLQSPSHVAQGHHMELKQLELQAKVKFSQHPFRFIGYKLGRLFSKLFIPNIADIVVRTLQASEFIIAEQSAKNANVVIHPNLVGINWYELYKVDELILLGEEAAMQQLPAIKKLIKD